MGINMGNVYGMYAPTLVKLFYVKEETRAK